jgi:hypothetical protein
VFAGFADCILSDVVTHGAAPLVNYDD